MHNKREFIRLSAYHLIKYRPLSVDRPEALYVIATIKDIGAGGICLKTEEYLPVSSVIELKINFPSHTTPIFALAKVVWIRQRDRSRYYDIGAQFIEIDEPLRKIVDRHIRLVQKSLDSKTVIWEKLFRKGGEIMDKICKLLIVVAFVSLMTALTIKMTTMGAILPGPMPVNWAKLADTFLLFSIALSLINKK